MPARYRAAVPEDLLRDAAPAREDLLPPLQPPAAPTPPPPPDPATLSPLVSLPAGGLDLRQHIAEIENELIRQALQQSNGVVAHAAPLLGLRRTTLLEKLRKYGIGRGSEGALEDGQRDA